MANKAQKLVLALLCLLLFLGPSSQLDTLWQGREIKFNEGDGLVSAQGNFRLGFFKLESNNYYLGIWYNNLAVLQENIVWVANRDTPIFNNSGSLTTLTLTIDGYGNLKILYNGGLSSVVLYSGQEVSNTSAVLLDTGNFVLLEQSTGQQLWQSFDYPSHTLLPGMKLGFNWKTGHTWSLRSWRGLNVPEVGDFTFGLDPNQTNRWVILWHGNIYWTSDPWNNSHSTLPFSSYDFSYVSNENETYFNYSVGNDITTTPRLSIDYLGNLNASSVTLVRCSPYTSPIYLGISFAFPIYGDIDSGCAVKTEATDHAKRWWIWLIVVVGGFFITLCFLCYTKWKKHREEGERKRKEKMLIQELRGNVMPSPVHDKVQKQNKDGQANHELQIFNFESISIATSNFSIKNKLGEGGFGLVYKGKLPNGQEIAIKRLSRNSGQGFVEFKNEAILIAKLQHTNLVRLVGFCIQEEEKILIYEYMPNKSLDFFLFDSTKKYLLNWKKRFNIIEGIAQGLVYLHKYSRLTIIHRDLKASNILLDEEMNLKISDFGMARIFGLRGLEENTNRVVGTYDYMSPEYAMNGVVSIKTDVFSFGVLLLEIVCGKKNNSRYQSYDFLNLMGYAWQLWNEGKVLELIDPIILDESCPPSEILRCIHVGLLCVQDHAIDRPTMIDVVSMLSNEALQLSPPKQPAFFINRVAEVLENCSLNNVTISEIEVR
ncbi:G-type lectin S-receptor-like serine/threonine-protein kinase CES101 [Castanea sativa]|uniref:G-type lectin S-receptor-like serine/threonine-protein kinase CES101 n=1 Tax=Castanea sativa TaxID=21020 RepID=UPI003F649FD6